MLKTVSDAKVFCEATCSYDGRRMRERFDEKFPSGTDNEFYKWVIKKRNELVKALNNY